MDISEFIEVAKNLNVLGIKITKDGELAAEWHSEPECRRNIYSATKSFTSCAVGFAVQEGLIDLNEKLTEAFSEDMPENIDDNLKSATVRDLLTMCLGQEKGNLMGEQRPLYKEDDWVKMSLAVPFKYRPGTHFVYNNVGPYLAGILVQRRSGCDLVSYLTPRLFSHLGIKRPTWETDPLGNSFGAGGLFLTLSELHKSIHTEQMESIARFPWFFRIKMQLSHLYRNAAEEKNLCAQFMILFAQNYKGRNVVGSSYMGILQLKSPLVSFLLENGIRKAPSPEKHFQKSTRFLLNF